MNFRAAIMALFAGGMNPTPGPSPQGRGGGQFTPAYPNGRGWDVGGRPGAYEGGRRTRRDMDWMPRGLGPNAENEQGDGGLERVQNRARDLADNHELVDGALYTATDNVVGTGIDDFEPDTGFEDLDAQLQRLWAWASKRVDPQRKMSLAESQRLYHREKRTVAEVGVYRPFAKAFNGWPAMPAIELVECERLEISRSAFLGRVGPGPLAVDGNTIRQGVEYDADGRVVAYHILRQHPRDGGFGGMFTPVGETVRLPIGAFEWCFTARRVNQLRGVPRLVSSLQTINTEGGFVGDVMMHAKTVAALGVFFTGIPAAADLFKPDASGNTPLVVDAAGNPVTRIEGASIGILPPGAKLEVAQPTIPGPTFESTEAALHRRMSRGMGVTYSDYAGDSTRSSFASIRVDQLAARKGFQPEQEDVWEHHTLPWWRDVTAWAVLVGRITLTAEQARELAADPDFLVRGTPGFPGTKYVNPAQEAAANATDILSGVRSPIEVIQDEGRNWRRVVQQTVKYARYLKETMAANNVTADDLAMAGKSVTLPGQSGDGSNGDGGRGRDEQAHNGGVYRIGGGGKHAAG